MDALPFRRRRWARRRCRLNPSVSGTFPAERLGALRESAERMGDALARGVRVGESAVASLRVHLLSAADPDAVTVLLDRDAGQVFYRRRQPGQILHLDVFHAPGSVPTALVARGFLSALGWYQADFPGCGASISPDNFDAQTALGGGRIGGSLRGGRRAGVLAAHRGHVHLAGRLERADLAFCFYLVAAVERVAAGVGLQPRKPRRVLCLRAGARGPADEGLDAYAALTDSWLSEPEPPGGAAGGEPQPGRAYGDALLAVAARLADDLGGVESARALLEGLGRPAHLSALRLPGWGGPRVRDAVAYLCREGLAVPQGSLWALTGRGEALRGTFGGRLREVELAMRSAARHIAGPPGHVAVGRGPLQAGGRKRPGRTMRLPRGERLGEVAVTETVLAAATRRGGAVGRGSMVRAEDVRVRRRHRPRRVDLCLLLDASASMEGERMRAAKMLARHLLLTSRDRVAVMAFQERGAVLAVGLTRNYTAAERGLGSVVAAGLTPLAAGLAAARQYLCRAHARHALLLLVTDGIPTVSVGGGSPLEEALAEAGGLRGSGIALSCIGLEPNEHYLRELARRAGGRLHVVAELRPDLLAAVARAERLRRLEGTADRRGATRSGAPCPL